jgi:RNA polymerase sigma-70 factor (ECF subfamily)
MIEARAAADASSGAPPAPGLDEAGFQVFYQKTARPLWSYVRRMVGDAAADDIVQEAFIRLLRAPVRTTQDADLRAYVFRIASNLVVDHWRRAKRERDHAAAAAVEATPTAGSPALGLDMARVFQQLKPKERALLWLAYVEGEEHRDIAGALQVKEKSVKVLLFRARRRLADLLKRRGVTGGGG